MKVLLIIPFFLLLSACTDEQALKAGISERWYSSEDVRFGQQIFTKNCAVCHGDKAQSVVKDWEQRLPDGSYPAPPLNGTAHAWHHPIKSLNRTIVSGTIPLGGTMPAFKDQLSSQERLQAIAYFQSFWSTNIYQAWLERGGLN